MREISWPLPIEVTSSPSTIGSRNTPEIAAAPPRTTCRNRGRKPSAPKMGKPAAKPMPEATEKTLFRNRVFSVASGIGFAAGFPIFGALGFLPLFLQVVRGGAAAISGVFLLPMVLGLLVTSIGSGQLISRIGRYKVFPVIG